MIIIEVNDVGNPHKDELIQIVNLKKSSNDSSNRLRRESPRQTVLPFRIIVQGEFDTYKTEQDKPLKNNLIKQFKKVLKQKQINIDALNEMKNKLHDIERGLEKLKQ
ncbi:unnamed protein product [Rotaria sp. Silwood1]|nr:unnamed protein product [Rotaria sp. Silwood1]